MNNNNDLLSIFSIGLAIYGLTRNKEETPLSNYDLAVQNGYTGTLAQYLASLKGRDGQNGKDGKDAINNFVSPEEFGAVGDGITDDLEAFKAAIHYSQTRNKQIRFYPGKKYFISQTILNNLSLNIDFSGSEVIAPNGLFERVIEARYDSGNYVTLEKDTYTIPAIEGVTENIQVGNIFVARSNTAYNTIGNYCAGQLFEVLEKNLDGSLTVNVPVYRRYTVDVIDVFPGGTVELKNLVLNQGSGTSATHGGHLYGYKSVILENVTCHGSPNALTGFLILADQVSLKQVQGNNYVNTVGSGSGRLGYGFGVNGNNVVINTASGTKNKHFICCNLRNVFTGNLLINGFHSISPTHLFTEMPFMGEPGGPLIQHALDLHGNCLKAEINGFYHYGCNGAIAVRNGNAVINSPVIYSTAVWGKYRNDYIISMYENPVTEVVINNPILTAEDRKIGQLKDACLIGIQPGLIGELNGSVTVNNLIQKGGALLGCEATTANNVRFKNIHFNNVDVEVSSGVNIKGTSGAIKAPKFDSLKLTGRVKMLSHDDKTLRLLNLEYLAELGRLDCSNSEFDYTEATDTPGIRMFFENGKPPFKMNFRNTVFKAGSGAFTFLNGTNGGYHYGNADFAGSEIQYNLNAKQDLTSVYGVYAQLLNDVGLWNFSGAKIKDNQSKVLATNNEGLRFATLSKLDISLLQINTSIVVTNTAYWSELISKRMIPFSARNTEGLSLPFLQFRLKDGKIYVPVSNQDTPGTETATPKATVPTYTGLQVFNEEPAAGVPYSWIYTGSAWSPLML